jgi:Cu/Ag efflux protein CusF
MSLKHIVLACSVLGFAASSAAAQQTRLTGSVVKIDEAAGTVSIRQALSETVGANAPNGPTEDYKLQEGLLFNALRYGDKVTFTVNAARGVKTITQLEIN